MKGIRVLVVDDEESVVDVLRALIGSDPSLEFVGAANDAERGIELAMLEQPDVVLLDVRMPGGGGIRAVREITKRCSPTKVVALSAHEDPDTMIRMIGAGAGAYVPKSESTDEILRAIHRSIDGDWEEGPRKNGSDPLRRTPVERRSEQRARVEQALQSDAVTAAFQPILELETGRVVGVEAQPRVVMLPSRPYDAWCADAESVGLLQDLELAAFRWALKALRRLPADRFVEFEVSGATSQTTTFQQPISSAAAGRVVLGFSELTPPDPGLGEALAPLRGRGVRLSVTDVGTEISSLDRVVRLSPEFVRIDPALTNDVDRDPSRHAIVAAVVAWATQVGAGAVAEHVISEEQLRELGRLGVGYVQGDHVSPFRHLAELRGQRRAGGRSVKLSKARADVSHRKVSPSGTPTSRRAP
jgi:EAL domain-containing protein (putative c-di-GMP-specific phosphodiesterase class I)/CheY-like chemotaxis protein